jgi:exosortase/archaeosortase family protein
LARKTKTKGKIKAPAKQLAKAKNAKTSPPITRLELLYLLKFLVIFAMLYALIKVLPLSPLLTLIASFEAQTLAQFGVAAVALGQTVYTANASFLVAPECSGLVMGAMLAALVFSTNVPHRLRVLAIFVPALFLFNLVRLAVTVYSGAIYGQQVLEIVHSGLWFVDAAVVFLIWIKVVSPQGNPLAGA